MDGRPVAPLAPTGFEDVGDRAGTERIAVEGHGNGGGEFVWAVVIQQREQAGRVGTD